MIIACDRNSNILNNDEIYYRKEFLFLIYIIMVCFRFVIIGVVFKFSYKCLFFIYIENILFGNL